MTEWIDAARVGLAAAGLSIAAYTDWKTREVPDGLWYSLGAAALVLVALDFGTTFGGLAWLLALPVASLFLVAVTGGEIVPVSPGADDTPPEAELTVSQRARYRLDVALTLALIAGAIGVFWIAAGLDLGRAAFFLVGPQAQAYSVSIMFAVSIGLFMSSLIAGGADMKALLVLAALFPIPPLIQGLPLVQAPPLAMAIVPFSLALFFNAGVLLIVAKLPLALVLSIRSGHVEFPESLIGYEKPLSAVDLDREWLLGRVVDGRWKRTIMGTHTTHSDESQKDAFEFLERAGRERVFVTPKIPFMVYLLAGFVMALLVTSPLYFVSAYR